MSDVVHQDGSLHGFGFRVEYEMPFLLERENGLAHQVEGTDGMLKTRVLGSRINHVGHTQLLDAGESLHQRMLNDIKQKTLRNLDESEHRVVNYFRVVHMIDIGLLLVMPGRFVSIKRKNPFQWAEATFPIIGSNLSDGRKRNS
jgi:hypothetical protein